MDGRGEINHKAGHKENNKNNLTDHSQSADSYLYGKWLVSTGLGYVRVKCMVRNPEDNVCEEIEMLADTGSWYVALPRIVANKLRLRIIGKERVTLADSKEIEVELAPIYIEVLGRGTHTLAAIIDAPEPLLGTSVMEVLGLVVDPKSGEMKKRGPRASYML
ncbi:hypothetical protein HRbin02_00984 [Candidatus Calditenuaceae archaeon HR02]|nr:hypothetical protein HRbin02_00984 [Candidatus Calditenuaceae archaeon HR02]